MFNILPFVKTLSKPRNIFSQESKSEWRPDVDMYSTFRLTLSRTNLYKNFLRGKQRNQGLIRNKNQNKDRDQGKRRRISRILSGSPAKSGPFDFGTKHSFPSFFVSGKDLAHIHKKAIYYFPVSYFCFATSQNWILAELSCWSWSER